MGLRRLIRRPLPLCASGAATLAVSVWFAASSQAFVPQERWGDTATALATAMGRPVTLTWSIVPDGTNIQGEGGSELVQFLDDVFGPGPGGTNLRQRPWFSLLDS